jgi:hypothetical protein
VDSDVGLALLIVTGALVIMSVFFRIVIIWLYNGSGRNVLVVALFHSAYNSAVSLGGQKFMGELISGSATLYAVGALVVLAVLLVVLTRGRLAHKPKRAALREARQWALLKLLPFTTMFSPIFLGRLEPHLSE